MDAAPHRADLDGLRGLAILSVFAVHTVPDSLAGGFIGVDVFFVLSGFLIASISLPLIDQGQFRALPFYGRRLRRLVPALLVVLVFCLAFAAWVALPQDVAAVGRQIAAGAGFVSNLLFWREAGYFDPSSEFKPLLHLWSLGVEAQFYALWPLLAFAMARVRGPRARLGIVSVALLASFILNVAFVETRGRAVFFLPLTRLWEPLAGAWLACALRCAPHSWRVAGPAQSPSPQVADGLAGLGMGAMVLSLLLLDKHAAFPGWWALLPTLATVMLIAGGGQGRWARQVLSQPLLCFYGRISYPLYLWHFPLLVMPRLMGMELDAPEAAGLLVLAVLAATATERWAEPALRQGPVRGLRALTLWGGLPATGLLGLWLAASPGGPERFPESLHPVSFLHLRLSDQGYRGEVCFLQSPDHRAEHFTAACDPVGDAGLASTLLWGDSHAAALYPGLAAAWVARLNSESSRAVLGQYTAAACPPLPPDSLRLPARCREINAGVLERIGRSRPQRVVLAGSWTTYAPPEELASLVDEIEATVRGLRQAGVADVLVLGPLPVWRVEPPRRLLGAWLTGQEPPLRARDGVGPAVLAVEAALQARMPAAGARYASPLDIACEADGCRVGLLDEQGRLLATAFDLSHLTEAGSRALGAPLLDRVLERKPATASP